MNQIIDYKGFPVFCNRLMLHAVASESLPKSLPMRDWWRPSNQLDGQVLNQTKPLNDAAIRSLMQSDIQREQMVRDIACPGLYLRLRPGANLSWAHLYTFDKRARRPSLGAYPDLSLAAARELVNQRRKLLAAGVDPEAKEREDKEALEAAKRVADQRLTVNALFLEWSRRDIKHRDGGELVRNHFERHVLPLLGELHAEAVTQRQVIAVIDAIRDKGSMRVANVILQLLKRMFRYAELREIIQKNPAGVIDRKDAGGQEQPRKRYLEDGEIQQLARVLQHSDVEETTQAALWLLLATLVRVGALCAAKWDDFDLQRRVYRAWDMKKQVPVQYDVFLSDFAVQQIERIKGEQTRKGVQTEWVLYSRKNKDEHVCEHSLNKQVQDRQQEHVRSARVSSSLLAMPSGRWKVHDLRRSGASHMKALGIHAEVRRACMNHVEVDRLALIYDQADIPVELRIDAFAKLGNKLEAFVANATCLPI